MWLVELMLLSLVGGILLGVGMHVWDKTWERAQANSLKANEQKDTTKTE
jgi:Tfp pilus assembly protein PilE